MSAVERPDATLARLFFWVLPARRSDFEIACEQQVIPLLKKHGLVESSSCRRPAAEGVFSLFFELENSSAITARAQALRKDPEWKDLLQRLGTAFGTARSDSLICHRFGLCQAPAGPGRTAEAGPGSRQGPWHTFGVRDGLSFPVVLSLCEDRQGNLWFGTDGGGVCRYDGNQFTVFTAQDGLAGNAIASILEDRQGNLWFGTKKLGQRAGEGVSRYDGQCFFTLTEEDGLAADQVNAILEDREGNLWFGTHAGGASRYDGERFTIFTTQDGLIYNDITSMLQDCRGNLWFGTWKGLSRWDGREFTTFTARDGLAGHAVLSILEDRQGHLWFATPEGASRYDGQRFATWTAADGLASDRVTALLEDSEGHLWFGTAIGGVSQYDGQRFKTFTTRDGLANNQVRSVLEDQRGYLWFGTFGGGVSRYDRVQFSTFTIEHGLVNNGVMSILEDRHGYLWLGTWGGGVSCYDGEHFKTFTTQNGLAHDMVTSVLEDSQGYLWFATFGGGVCRYDGRLFQTLSARDGLAHDAIHQIIQDRRGDIWMATEGGLTRYRPGHIPPSVQITDVIADRQYGPVQEVHLPSSQQLLIFEFRGRSWTTPPEDMAYAYRLEGRDPDWQVTHVPRAEYQDLALGEYAFQVRAVDRDLNYSATATARVKVEPDPRIEALTEALSAPTGDFLGTSLALRQALSRLEQVAPIDLTVLILGETGTGKGLAARTLHRLSPRKAGPFVQVSCGALPRDLVENELFGHERGAFTGALPRKLGKVELAQGGTLFLDEIGDLAPEAQVKLLRLLEERTFERVGGTQTLKADVRIVAATNRDLKQLVEKVQFRQDLYFRLQVFVVPLPPLRQRREDIPVLAQHFMQRMAAHLNKEVKHLAPEALAMLMAYDWPGNVRELEHAVQRAVIVCPGSVIRAEDIALEFGPRAEGSPESLLPPEEYERRYLVRVLEECGWVVKGPRGAAAYLGMPASTLQSRMKKLGLWRP